MNHRKNNQNANTTYFPLHLRGRRPELDHSCLQKCSPQYCVNDIYKTSKRQNLKKKKNALNSLENWFSISPLKPQKSIILPDWVLISLNPYYKAPSMTGLSTGTLLSEFIGPPSPSWPSWKNFWKRMPIQAEAIKNRSWSQMFHKHQVRIC